MRALDFAGLRTPAPEQAAKVTEFLAAGRHLVSPPVVQDDRTVAMALQTLSWERVRTYQGGQWLTRDASRPWSPLLTLEAGAGYWVEVAADGWWTTAGAVPGVVQVTLQAGWNLVGYGGLIPKTVAEALAGVNYLAVEGFANAPPYNLKSLTLTEVMTPGNGYWVRVSQDTVLTFVN